MSELSPEIPANQTSVAVLAAEQSLTKLLTVIGVAFFLLIGWLLLATIIPDLPAREAPFAAVAWLVLFIWIHLLPGDRRVLEAGVAQFRNIGSGIPRRLLPWLLGVVVTLAAFEPWWHALFTIGCTNGKWGNTIWPQTDFLKLGDLPIAVGVSVFVLRTAMYPLVEETAFRGWMLAPLLGRFGTRKAVVMTSLLFSALHLQFHPGLFLSYFLIGMILGYVAIVTSSVWASIAVHLTWNLTGMSLEAFAPLHLGLIEIFNTRLFRCGPSALLVGLSLAIMAWLIRAMAVNARSYRIP